ncbi:MAG: lysostaphin resistance A-like protein [Leucobacter sp.]
MTFSDPEHQPAPQQPPYPAQPASRPAAPQPDPASVVQHEPTQPDPAAAMQSEPSSAPPQWAWAGAQLTQTVETEPLEYHRLLRGVRNYRWWKPLLLLIVAGVYFGILTVILGVIFIPLLMLGDPEYVQGLTDGSAEILDTQRPLSVLLSMLSVIIMLPAVLLAMLTLGMRPMGRVWSVAVKIRWGLLLRLMGVAVLAMIVMHVVGIAVGVAMNPASLSEASGVSAEGGSRDFDATAAMISALLVLLLVPLQATAEEVVFRGLFMQVIGAWLKNPWFAILIPTVLFVLGHIYDIWGLMAVGILGVVAGWLTWRTGGLEAAMAIHIINNLVAFGFLVLGVGGETAQTESAGGPEGVIGEAAGLALFIWLTLKVFRRGGHGRTRIDLVEVPVPATTVPNLPTADWTPGQVSDQPQPAAAAPSTAAAPAEAGSAGVSPTGEGPFAERSGEPREEGREEGRRDG